ncbi:Uncharacterized protein HZ326_12083 [Fusarium oxysporum f. sp. albedinis]|nr:Uncharacterized protein HZ326_12083 [Fusarium oxysporum f. sp. albedinis]
MRQSEEHHCLASRPFSHLPSFTLKESFLSCSNTSERDKDLPEAGERDGRNPLAFRFSGTTIPGQLVGFYSGSELMGST